MPDCIVQLAEAKERLRVHNIEGARLRAEIDRLEAESIPYFKPNKPMIPIPAESLRFGPVGALRKKVVTSKEGITKARLEVWIGDYFRQNGLPDWETRGQTLTKFIYDSRQVTSRKTTVGRSYYKKRRFSADVEMK